MSEENPTYFERLQKIKLDQLPKEAVAKPKKYLKPISDKRRIAKEQDKALGVDGKYDLWYEERKKQLTGKCLFCGGKTTWKDEKYWRAAIAHLLPKRKSKFPSVACHPDNFIELCMWSNSCHQNFDNGFISWEFIFDSKEWKIIEPKLKNIIPFVAPNEIKNLPPLLYDLFIDKK